MPALKWIGKDKIVNYHNEVPFCSLNERTEYSVNSNNTENLLIKGDNLEALKALLPFYYNRIKAIYIDPPYNTGNENWAFNDNVNSPEIRSWLGKVVGGETDDLSRHDKWLCMMYPRLRLLSELLSEDGVCFVSIDDKEVNHLRALMDEVFGVRNYLGLISVVNNLKGRSDDEFIATANEFLMVYAKSGDSYEMGGFPLSEEQIQEYDKEDERGKYKEVGLRKTGKGWRREDRPNMYYAIYFNEKTGQISLERQNNADIEILPLTLDAREGRWRWEPKTLLERKDKDIVVRKVRTGRWSVFTKMRLNESGEERTLLPKSVWIDPKYDTAKGAAMLRQIFGDDVFDNPKPLDFVIDILRVSTGQDNNDIVLDSFAGSGTTGHAVLDLNKEDGGNRKFILVEMENDIAEKVTAKRLRRVIHGYSYEKSSGQEVEVEGLGGGFKFLELGKPLFDKHKQIIGEPSYEDLAGYIYFTETHCTVDWGKANRDDWYVGENGGVRYFVIYGGKNELDEEFLEIAKRYQGKKVVYADVVMIDDDELERFDIIFKQVPYEMKTF